MLVQIWEHVAIGYFDSHSFPYIFLNSLIFKLICCLSFLLDDLPSFILIYYYYRVCCRPLVLASDVEHNSIVSLLHCSLKLNFFGWFQVFELYVMDSTMYSPQNHGQIRQRWNKLGWRPTTPISSLGGRAEMHGIKL